MHCTAKKNTVFGKEKGRGERERGAVPSFF